MILYGGILMHICIFGSLMKSNTFYETEDILTNKVGVNNIAFIEDDILVAKDRKMLSSITMEHNLKGTFKTLPGQYSESKPNQTSSNFKWWSFLQSGKLYYLFCVSVTFAFLGVTVVIIHLPADARHVGFSKEE